LQIKIDGRKNSNKMNDDSAIEIASVYSNDSVIKEYPISSLINKVDNLRCNCEYELNELISKPNSKIANDNTATI
jgi:hypothetical protein